MLLWLSFFLAFLALGVTTLQQETISPWQAPPATKEELEAVRKVCLEMLPIKAKWEYAYLKDCSIGRVVPVYEAVGDPKTRYYFVEAIKEGKPIAMVFVAKYVQIDWTEPPIKFWQEDAVSKVRQVVAERWKDKQVKIGQPWFVSIRYEFHIHMSPKWRDERKHVWSVPILGSEGILGFVHVDGWTGETQAWHFPVTIGRDGMKEEQAKAIAWYYIQALKLHETYTDLQPPKRAFFQPRWKGWSVGFVSKVITSPVKDDPEFPFHYDEETVISLYMSKYGELFYLWLNDPDVNLLLPKRPLKRQ